MVFVGEQPGDQEDLAGKPFVGPAGSFSTRSWPRPGVDRSVTYVTNAVKHFKFEPRGKRRIHAKPNAGEVQACRWWLDHELRLTKPDLVVALGATAAMSLLGKAVPITKMRGQTVTREDGLRVFLTVHPSYLLRLPDEATKAAERQRFLSDLKRWGLDDSLRPSLGALPDQDRPQVVDVRSRRAGLEKIPERVKCRPRIVARERFPGIVGKSPKP